MEASDPTVSVDLLIRALLAAGASRKEIGGAIGKAAPRRKRRAATEATADNRLGSCNAACGRYRRRHENGSSGGRRTPLRSPVGELSGRHEPPNVRCNACRFRNRHGGVRRLYFQHIVVEWPGVTNGGSIKPVTISPTQCGGKPCVRGLRIRVSDVLDLLASGLSPAEVLRSSLISSRRTSMPSSGSQAGS